MTIPTDKLLHALTGYAIAAFFIPLGALAAIIITVAAGIGWELYQKWTKRGVCDKKDIWATIGGGIAYLFVTVFHDWIGTIF